ncbi:MAG: alkaline phosphatase family protein [Trueperaceae bacterium]
MPRLIIVMIDGVSAGYVDRRRRNLPNLEVLAKRGLYLKRIAADVPGTSLPGRTSIVTGVPASEHGVFGNMIWDGQRFRYANPDDVRVPTLPRAAMDAGLRSAVVGFGMIRPEDATHFMGPWWANEMLQRARDEAPVPADESWLRTSRQQDSTGVWQRLTEAGFPNAVADAYAGDLLHHLLAGMAGATGR